MTVSGHQRIKRATSRMPVLSLLRSRHEKDKPLAGRTVSICSHLEAKLAVLVEAVRSLGANVVVAGSNSLSTQDAIANELGTLPNVKVYGEPPLDRLENLLGKAILKWRHRGGVVPRSLDNRVREKSMTTCLCTIPEKPPEAIDIGNPEPKMTGKSRMAS